MRLLVGVEEDDVFARGLRDRRAARMAAADAAELEHAGAVALAHRGRAVGAAVVAHQDLVVREAQGAKRGEATIEVARAVVDADRDGQNRRFVEPPRLQLGHLREQLGVGQLVAGVDGYARGAHVEGGDQRVRRHRLRHIHEHWPAAGSHPRGQCQTRRLIRIRARPDHHHVGGPAVEVPLGRRRSGHEGVTRPATHPPQGEASAASRERLLADQVHVRVGQAR